MPVLVPKKHTLQNNCNHLLLSIKIALQRKWFIRLFVCWLRFSLSQWVCHAIINEGTPRECPIQTKLTIVLNCRLRIDIVRSTRWTRNTLITLPIVFKPKTWTYPWCNTIGNWFCWSHGNHRRQRQHQRVKYTISKHVSNYFLSALEYRFPSERYLFGKRSVCLCAALRCMCCVCDVNRVPQLNGRIFKRKRGSEKTVYRTNRGG